MAETTTIFDAASYTADGTARERVPLPATLFDGTVNMPVMHQAVKAFLANQRQGNASTKTRGLVTGGNRKPWRQKGTGRAPALEPIAESEPVEAAEAAESASEPGRRAAKKATAKKGAAAKRASAA